jgi:kynurenine formamidase
MKMIDLTHPLTADMPQFPGSPQPTLEQANSGHSWVTTLNLTTHTGTHMDAPAHVMAEGPGLGDLPLDRFFGLALLADARSCPGGQIDAAFLQSLGDDLRFVQFLVLFTGHYEKWGSPDYYGTFPILTPEAARLLAELPDLSGVAFDTPSADPVGSTEMPIHHILLEGGKLILENLTNLDRIQGDHFLLSALPLLYDRADGSPIRAVAFQAPAGIYYPR